MSLEPYDKGTGTRHKAREAALQMLFARDMAGAARKDLAKDYWNELGDETYDERTREFANALAIGTLDNIEAIDATIKTRAEHWRIERMAFVDRNVLRLAVFEFLFFDTPDTVAINEALELARKYSSYEATQFINGVLDAIRQDILNRSKDNESGEVSTTTSASS
ncbi:MAG TPA: transcription antitermination factor NusB [Pyrinomonadaceae bacterium]|nr:transcription antitermination factor NusB [Pyrinomonadaceae bacterium]